MKLFASAFAATALFTSFVQAAPLDPKNVAADAKWVVQVDVDAIRDSKVVQKAFDTCPELKNSGKHFDMIRDKAGIDLRKDLHGITLYGPDADKTHAVAIVLATVNQKPLLALAALAPDHKVTKHGDIEIHSWTAKHGTKTHPAAGAFYKSDAIVFAATAEKVAAAIDVLDGKSPSLEASSPLATRLPAGATLLARSTAIPANERCPVLKHAKSFRVAMGENDGKSFYRAGIVMNSAEDAAQVKAIVDGFKALGTLKFSGDADMMKLVDPLQVTVREATVRIRWEASADDVWTAAEKIGKKIGEHIKKMKAAHAKAKPAK
jgi:hypothetical protein